MNILNLFMQDHRHCDALFNELENAVRSGVLSEAAAVCEKFRAAMENHFLVEEEELFPAFERATGIVSGTTSLMRAEHVRMRSMMLHMSGALAAGDLDSYLDEALELRDLLERHAIKEEHLVYALCDERLSSQQQFLAEALARRAAAQSA